MMDESNPCEVCPHCGKPVEREQLTLEELTKVRKLLASFKEAVDRELRLRQMMRATERYHEQNAALLAEMEARGKPDGDGGDV